MNRIYAIQDVINAISEARKAKGLTQTELGKRLGLPQSYISKLESGGLDARLSGIIDIARYLNLEIMLVPNKLTTLVSLLIDSNDSTQIQQRPMYMLEDIDD